MAENDPGGAGGGDVIRRRDEILQVMYWMRGEGLGETIGAAELSGLVVGVDEEVLRRDLAGLADAGLTEAVGGKHRLTARGVAEGGRRFAEEFQDLTGQAHGACSDPECDCRRLGPAACTHAGAVDTS